MGYLNDIIGLLSLRENFGLGREQLGQRAKEFEAQFGLDKEEALRAAQQWEQRFQEQKAKRLFEEVQERNKFAEDQKHDMLLDADRYMRFARNDPMAFLRQSARETQHNQEQEFLRNKGYGLRG